MRFKAFLCNWRIGSVTVPLPPSGLKISFACTAPWLGTAVPVAVVALVLLCCCWLKGYLNPTPFCYIVLSSVLAPQVLVKICLMGGCSWGKFLSDFLTSQKTVPGCLQLSHALHPFPVLADCSDLFVSQKALQDLALGIRSHFSSSNWNFLQAQVSHVKQSDDRE